MYRAYRYPYDYVKQVKAPKETPVEYKDPFIYDPSISKDHEVEMSGEEFTTFKRY